MPRIHVIGSAGAGKTVLASRLAAAFAVPLIELDALFWGENWQKADTDTFRRVVRDALSVDGWVTDGNYGRVRDIVWDRIETIVWLDYPLGLVLWRLFWRTMKRIFSRELLWGGNRESFFKQFFTRESLFLYVLRTHKNKQSLYEQLSQSPDYAGIEFVRLRSPRQARRWFRDYISLTDKPAG